MIIIPIGDHSSPYNTQGEEDSKPTLLKRVVHLVCASNFLNFDLSIFANRRNALARSLDFLLEFRDRARQASDIANGLFGFCLVGFWLLV